MLLDQSRSVMRSVLADPALPLDPGMHFKRARSRRRVREAALPRGSRFAPGSLIPFRSFDALLPS